MNEEAGRPEGKQEIGRRTLLVAIGVGSAAIGVAGAAIGLAVNGGGDSATGPRSARKAVVRDVAAAHDWSEENPPWASTSATQFTADWPQGTVIVDIQTTAADFYTNLVNTVNAAGERCVVRLGEGVYTLTSFRLYGDSGDPGYAFGFFIPHLQGLLGQGPDKTCVRMEANSMSPAQLDRLAGMDRASFTPVEIGFCRFDGSESSPVLLSGLSFQADDQQMLTDQADDVGIFLPQPAPHNGVRIYTKAHSIVSYCCFRAAGRACTSAPPFECANLMSGQGVHHWHHCEFDGRRHPSLDSARPRRCGPLMANSEHSLVIEDSWLHHSNVSRYAVNDQNNTISGEYTLRRVKVEQISNEHNTDPALNDGQTLGGWTNASLLGWESCNGTILVDDCILSQDNSSTDVSRPMHLQLTSVGDRNPQGGRMQVRGGEFRNTGFPDIDGYVTFLIPDTTYWWTDGFATTLDVRRPDGGSLEPHVITGTWPPTTASLTAAGVSSRTHYLVRTN